ncbi:MAG TPA: hypothetical protein VLH75_14340 [Longimicrobiales bacterium]|nr:hypothetical protein [Longimicrobiales bacterium]
MLGDVIVRGASGLLERWERSQVLSVSQDVLEELLLLECKVNLEIIDLLKSQDPAAALSAAVARAIRLDVFEQLFTKPKEAERVRARLADEPAIREAGGEAHLRNVYARGMAIQEIARLGGEAGAVPGVLLGRRLKNLRADLLRVVKALSR